jgi:two-component system, NtrC family, nitrogen regulation sensor histidine kinase NtrY
LSPELVTTLIEINPGENKLVRVQDQDDLLQLAIYATELKIHNKEIILSTIKNIQNVLEEQETEAWQKLISVLTHEIMNSITPIASLSSTLDMMLRSIARGEKDQPLDMETVDGNSAGTADYQQKKYRTAAFCKHIPEPDQDTKTKLQDISGQGTD